MKRAPSLWTAIRSLRQSDFFRKVAATFGTRVAMMGIGVVTSVVVARLLGPEGRGYFATVTAISGIGIQLGNLGLHTSNIYFVSKNKRVLPTLVGNTLWVSLGLGSLAALAAWILFLLFPFLSPLEQPALLAVALVTVPLGLASLLLQNVLLGLDDVRSFNLVDLAGRFFTLVLLGVLALAGWVDVLNVSVAGALTALFTLGWFAARIFRRHIGRLRSSWEVFKEHVRYGFRAYLSALFAYTMLRIDILMVKYMQGAEQTGYYHTAVVLGELAYQLPLVVGTLLFPKLSAMRDDRSKWAYTRKILMLVAVSMAPILLAAAFLAKPAVGLLYGAPFLPAVPPFLILLIAIYILSLNSLLMNFLGATGMPSITVTAYLWATLLNVALNLFLIPAYGIKGASWSSVAAYGLALVLLARYVLIHRKKWR